MLGICRFLVFFLILPNFSKCVQPNSESNLDSGFIFRLQNYTGLDETVLTSQQLLPQNSEILIQILDIPSSVSFIVVQAHSYLYNVSLSYSEELSPTFHINGTNIGLVYYINNSRTATLFLKNANVFNVSAMVAISPYTKKAPIPGGCNLEFSTYTAPYLNIKYDAAMVVVDGQPAMAPEDVTTNSCNVRNVKYKIQYLYMVERDFSVESYFKGIISMLTPSEAEKVGSAVLNFVNQPPLRYSFGAYKGTGTIYTLTAESEDGTKAAYVPTHTYACNNSYNINSCQLLTSTFSRVICAAVLFVGILLCFAGHIFFILELFIMGTIAGGVSSYILLIQNATKSTDYTLLAFVIGVGCGLVWVLIWWLIHSLVISLLLPLLILGFMISCIIFFSGITDFFEVFENDINYWITFATITIMITLVLLMKPKFSNIKSCSVLGGYAIVLPIDYYAGTNLKYILLNVINRATVDDFKFAKIQPPFQTPDTILAVVWIILSFLGVLSQKLLSKGRPPFLPPVRCCSREPSGSDLTTPLLANARFFHYSPGSDDVFHA